MALHNKIHWDADGLRRMYEDEGMTVKQIGKSLGVSSKAVNKACKRLGVQMRRRGPKEGPGHTGWKGGVTTDKGGYLLRYKPKHPNCNSGGYVREHRLVMEQKLGRPLESHEVVHHLDDDPANNHPDNLQLFASNADHLRVTRAGRVPQWSQKGKEAILAAIRRPRSSSRRQSAGDAPASSVGDDRSKA